MEPLNSKDEEIPILVFILRKRLYKINLEMARKTGLESQQLTEEVFESERPIVFARAENRMHAIKSFINNTEI